MVQLLLICEYNDSYELHIEIIPDHIDPLEFVDCSTVFYEVLDLP